MDVARAATGLNAGRVVIGLAMVAAPAAAGQGWFGVVAREPGGQAAVRALGIREVALGAATIGTLRATGPSGTGFAVLAGLGIAVDAVDAVATAAAWRALPGTGKAVLGIALGAAATGIAVLAGRNG